MSLGQRPSPGLSPYPDIRTEDTEIAASTVLFCGFGTGKLDPPSARTGFTRIGLWRGGRGRCSKR